MQVSIKTIRKNTLRLLDERVQEGYCLMSRVTGPTGFAFRDSSAGQDQNSGCGCFVGVAIGEFTGCSADYRKEAARQIGRGVTEADVEAIEGGFEEGPRFSSDDRTLDLRTLGREIRARYGA